MCVRLKVIDWCFEGFDVSFHELSVFSQTETSVICYLMTKKKLSVHLLYI